MASDMVENATLVRVSRNKGVRRPRERGVLYIDAVDRWQQEGELKAFVVLLPLRAMNRNMVVIQAAAQKLPIQLQNKHTGCQAEMD